ncbi:MAG: HPr(Ser) kinase/phosphatase [Spirochaetes bacterium]|nr:HPr(Ser) kinase/phosphatase [Spirochaetota bacterium]
MKLYIKDILVDFYTRLKGNDITVLTDSVGLNNYIDNENILSPIPLMENFSEGFIPNSIILFGKIEFLYLQKKKDSNINFLNNKNISLIIFTDDNQPSKIFIDICKTNNICVIKTNINEIEIKKFLMIYLEDKFAPLAVIHGDFIEVFGVGILITGNSGIGKSETTLELIHRGHRLIVDDLVTIKRMSGNFLFGYGSKIAPHYMEIRGVGIIDISRLYGIGVVRDKKRVELQVHLEEWQKSKAYDRTGLVENTTQILGITIPYIILPIRPGRNIPTIIETAAMNFRLKKLGIDSAKEMNKKLKDFLKKEKQVENSFDSLN